MHGSYVSKAGSTHTVAAWPCSMQLPTRIMSSAFGAGQRQCVQPCGLHCKAKIYSKTLLQKSKLPTPKLLKIFPNSPREVTRLGPPALCN